MHLIMLSDLYTDVTVLHVLSKTLKLQESLNASILFMTPLDKW